MKKFVVERDFPGAGSLSPEQLHAVTKTFCDSIDLLDKPRHWIQSFITDSKIYSIHIAENVDNIQSENQLVSDGYATGFQIPDTLKVPEGKLTRMYSHG
jgi:hypothetical protein